MNILLFSPGLLLLLLQANGFAGTAICLSICAGVQVKPQLSHDPCDCHIPEGSFGVSAFVPFVPTAAGTLLDRHVCTVLLPTFLPTVGPPR